MSYRPELSATWWLKNKAFKAYMLREATVLPLLFFLGCLAAGIYSLSQGEAQWLAWQIWLKQPWVLILNGLAVLASLYHAWTFFQLFPRVMPLQLAGRKVPPQLMVLGQWSAVVAVFILMAWLFKG